MEIISFFIDIIGICLGYLIGSILPAQVFGRLNGIDIRKVGTLNAGTMNVYHSLGLVYAIPTAAYDTFKGLLAMWVAYLIGANFIVIQVAALMAIVGHVFPFYNGFKGGQGVATAVGILLFYLVNYLLLGQLLVFITFIGFCLILVVIFAYVTKKGEFLSILILPLLGFFMFITYPMSPYNLFFVIIIAHITGVGTYNIIHQKLIVIENEEFKLHWWRVAARPFAVLFVIFDNFFTHIISLLILGIVALTFIAIDLSKMLSRSSRELLTQRVKSLFRKGEERFSSMTLFLVAAFITIFLFNQKIAIAALSFAIFGDLFSKIFGMGFGRHKIFDKSLEGSLAYLGCTLMCWYILSYFFPEFIYIILIGAVIAPLIELFSARINDNFSVPIVSGVIMEVCFFFGL